MAGQPTETGAVVALEDGVARSRVDGVATSVLDVRPPQLFTLAEEDEALTELARKAGPATAGIARRVEDAFASLRAELNITAGGQASSRVMTLAHNAQRAQLAVELQTSIVVGSHGKYVANDGDRGQAEKGLHRLVGICAFATDLLNKAHAAAKEEAEVKKDPGDATAALLTSLGAGPARSPIDTPGGSRLEPRLLSFQQAEQGLQELSKITGASPSPSIPTPPKASE